MSKILINDILHIIEEKDLDTYKKIYDREQPCSCICKICGKEFFQHLRFINFVCKNCKTKSTCKSKYGFDNPSYVPEIIEKIRVNNKANLPETRNKYTQTCIKKYGVDNVFKSDEIKQKIKKSNLDKFGVEHPLQSKEVLEKYKQTCINTFGVEYPAQCYDIQIKAHRKYNYHNIQFDSSWELSYYIWLSDNNISFIYHPNVSFPYELSNGTVHYYQPDFIVNNELVEIKGNQFYSRTGKMINPYDSSQSEKYQRKFELMVSLGVKILNKKEVAPYIKYVQDIYGRDYIKNFRNN